MPEAQWLETAQICPLAVLEVGSIKSRCWRAAFLSGTYLLSDARYPLSHKVMGPEVSTVT